MLLTAVGDKGELEGLEVIVGERDEVGSIEFEVESRRGRGSEVLLEGIEQELEMKGSVLKVIPLSS